MLSNVRVFDMLLVTRPTTFALVQKKSLAESGLGKSIDIRSYGRLSELRCDVACMMHMAVRAKNFSICADKRSLEYKRVEESR